MHGKWPLGANKGETALVQLQLRPTSVTIAMNPTKGVFTRAPRERLVWRGFLENGSDFPVFKRKQLLLQKV